jgi:hypothetical protein
MTVRRDNVIIITFRQLSLPDPLLLNQVAIQLPSRGWVYTSPNLMPI